jgi:hypothetical protein
VCVCGMVVNSRLIGLVRLFLSAFSYGYGLLTKIETVPDNNKQHDQKVKSFYKEDNRVLFLFC